MTVQERGKVFDRLVFRDETVRVDGNTYTVCEFYNCKLEFGGVVLPIFRGCRLDNADWVFVDAAANMVSFLSYFFHEFGASGEQLVDQLFQQIRQKQVMPSDAPVLLAELSGTASGIAGGSGDLMVGGAPGWQPGRNKK